jgi:phospho-N-acetylmuramoyl-pentapeptide-transferase
MRAGGLPPPAIDRPEDQERFSYVRAILLSSGLAVICSLLGTRVAIGWFTTHGFGQPIRDDGPTTHHLKRGTPTMGGLVILLSATAAYLVATMLTGGRPSASVWLLLLLFLGCGVVGFLDDFIKVYTQDNRGLTSRAKMAGQTVVALGFGILATQFFADERGVRPASQYISTTRDWGIRLPLVVVLVVICSS